MGVLCLEKMGSEQLDKSIEVARGPTFELGALSTVIQFGHVYLPMGQPY